MTFTVRPEEDEADRAFILGLNGRLCGVIDAPTHSKDEVETFQDRFTASAWADHQVNAATFVAIGMDSQRLGYVHIREGTDEIAGEGCAYIALLAVIADAEGNLSPLLPFTAALAGTRFHKSLFSHRAQGKQ